MDQTTDKPQANQPHVGNDELSRAQNTRDRASVPQRDSSIGSMSTTTNKDQNQNPRATEGATAEAQQAEYDRVNKQRDSIRDRDRDRNSDR